MPSDLSILNTALVQLKQTEVADTEGDSLTSVARKVLALLATAREAILERHGWLCALTYATLPAVGSGLTNWKYDAGFYLPGDFLRLWVIEGYPEDVAYEVGSIDDDGVDRKVLWVNGLTSANIAYVRNLKSTGLTPNLADAVAWELADRCVGAATSDTQLQLAMPKLAAAKLAWAMGIDGTQEGGQDPLVPDDAYYVRRSVA